MIDYCREGVENLCNAIVIAAVQDARRGTIRRADFRKFIFSDWAFLLLRGSATAESIYKEVYPNG